MVIELPPGSSRLACAGAALLLGLHVTGGLVGLASGFTALAARKGSTLHRRSGTLFFGAMLLMALLGAATAIPLGHLDSVLAGSLCFYLVLSGRMSVKRRGSGPFESLMLLLALAIAAGGCAFVRHALGQPGGMEDAIPGGVFTALALLGASGDFRLIRRGGLSGTPRIVRHLWRMCVALLIAAVSLFLGQQRIFPAALRGSFLFYLPELLILGALLFWLVRLRRRASAPAWA